MCRYGQYGPYKEKWACFKCRKSFKQRSALDLPSHVWKRHEVSGIPLCPQCKAPLNNMGLDFKAPPQSNIKQWKKVELLFQHNLAFHSCGCEGPGKRPKTLREIPDFLEELSQQAGQGSRKFREQEQEHIWQNLRRQKEKRRLRPNT